MRCSPVTFTSHFRHPPPRSQAPRPPPPSPMRLPKNGFAPRALAAQQRRPRQHHRRDASSGRTGWVGGTITSRWVVRLRAPRPAGRVSKVFWFPYPVSAGCAVDNPHPRIPNPRAMYPLPRRPTPRPCRSWPSRSSTHITSSHPLPIAVAPSAPSRVFSTALYAGINHADLRGRESVKPGDVVSRGAGWWGLVCGERRAALRQRPKGPPRGYTSMDSKGTLADPCPWKPGVVLFFVPWFPFPTFFSPPQTLDTL